MFSLSIRIVRTLLLTRPGLQNDMREDCPDKDSKSWDVWEAEEGLDQW